MTQEFDDILSFDASQLTINNRTETKSAGNPHLYRPRPADAKSEDGIYRATIKVIWNPYNLRNSVLEQQSYALQDANGFFTVVSSLTDNDTNCPVFKAWKTCHYSKDVNMQRQELPKDKGGRGLFDKRFARFVTIQVLDDPNNPDLNGKYMLWKAPKAVWELIKGKQEPTNPAKSPIPVMDFLFGRSIDIEIKPGPGKPGEERYARETSYTAELSEETVPCVNPDGSSLLTPTQEAVLNKYVEAMKEVWKEKVPETRNIKKAQIDVDANTRELKAFYREVINKIKSFCPDLFDELGYKPWSEDVTTRVQNWINIVLAGNDPTATGGVPVVADTVGTVDATPTAHTYTAPSESTAAFLDEEDEGLPF
jgi:hypothetical protein